MRITTAIALVAILTAPLAASANPSTNGESNGRTLTSIETIRYGSSERSDPNWDRVERHSAGQGSSR